MSTKTSMPLGEYLYQAGKKHNLHFTFEFGGFHLPAVPLMPLSGFVVTKADIPDNIDDLCKQVEDELGHHFAAVRNPENPSVIQLIDTRLVSETEYVLNRKIDFKYDGLVASLPDAIGQVTADAVGSRRVFATGELFTDFVTKIDVHAKNKTIRAILTDYIPLSGYNVMIWNAVTWNNGGKPETGLQYYGPSKQK